MPKGKHPCEDCGKPTDLRGWYFLMPKNLAKKKKLDELKWRRNYHWWCGYHYKMYMFNLIPYKCTERCRKKHELITSVKLNKEEFYVWIQLETTLAFDGPSPKPKCPWCSKEMLAVK